MLNWLEEEVPEQVIDPQLPIVDAHHHMWAKRPGWSSAPAMADDVGCYLLPQILEDIQRCGHNIKNTVYVQSGAMYAQDGPEHLRSVGETRFAQGVASTTESGVFGGARVASAIVGFADLLRGAQVEEVLLEHMRNPNFRGVRQIPKGNYRPIGPNEKRRRNTYDEGDAETGDLYCNKHFREGFAALDRLGLSFDAW